MDRYRLTGRTAAGVLAGSLGVAALLVAGCSSSPGGSGSGSGGSQSTNSKSGGSGGSGSSGGSGNSGGSGGSGTTTASGSPLFPVAVGEKWVYIDHLGTLGSGTTSNTVTAVKPASGGELVTMRDVSNLPGGPTKPGTLTYMFYSDGSISVPFTQFGGGLVTVKSGSIVWPPASVIASGQPHNSTLVVSIKLAGHAITERIHVSVQGAGTHSVTVPAGTYQATAVNETLAPSILGHTVKIEVRTWLAPGVGPVKSEVLNRGSLGGGLSAVEVLKSFTK